MCPRFRDFASFAIRQLDLLQHPWDGDGRHAALLVMMNKQAMGERDDSRMAYAEGGKAPLFNGPGAGQLDPSVGCSRGTGRYPRGVVIGVEGKLDLPLSMAGWNEQSQFPLAAPAPRRWASSVT